MLYKLTALGAIAASMLIAITMIVGTTVWIWNHFSWFIIGYFALYIAIVVLYVIAKLLTRKTREVINGR